MTHEEQSAAWIERSQQILDEAQPQIAHRFQSAEFAAMSDPILLFHATSNGTGSCWNELVEADTLLEQFPELARLKDSPERAGGHIVGVFDGKYRKWFVFEMPAVQPA